MPAKFHHLTNPRKWDLPSTATAPNLLPVFFRFAYACDRPADGIPAQSVAFPFPDTRSHAP